MREQKSAIARWLSQPERFIIQRSDDPAKRDMELMCPWCKERVCDVEDGDELGVLIGVAEDHEAEWCKKKGEDDE